MSLLSRRDFVRTASLAAFGQTAARPNLLLLLSDDQSWLDTGIGGNKALRTPAFDQIAREGALFTHAFCSSPSCAPSRAAILTGQDFWRLQEGANMRSHLPAQFTTYAALLEAAGYRVGSQGKGYGPTDPRDKTQNPAGRAYPSFACIPLCRANRCLSLKNSQVVLGVGRAARSCSGDASRTS